MLFNLRGQISDAISSAAAHMAAVVIALLLGLVGFIFLMIGVAVLLQSQMTAWQAFALVGTVLLIAGVFVIVAARLRAALSDQSGGQRRQTTAEQQRMQSYMAIGEDLGQIVKARPKEAVVTGLVIGLVLGFSPELRHGLLSLATDIETDRNDQP